MELNVTDIRENLADALNRVAYAGERFVLKRRAKSVAALVSIADLALLEQMEDAEDIKAARKALKEKGRVPLAKVKKRLGMK